MLRNLPIGYTQEALVDELRDAGFDGTYDFLHVPTYLGAPHGTAHAFINFVQPAFAWKFKACFEGRQLGAPGATGVASVVPATLQGYEANLEHHTRRGAPAHAGLAPTGPLLLRQAPSAAAAAAATRRQRKQPRALPAAPPQPPAHPAATPVEDCRRDCARGAAERCAAAPAARSGRDPPQAAGRPRRASDAAASEAAAPGAADEPQPSPRAWSAGGPVPSAAPAARSGGAHGHPPRRGAGRRRGQQQGAKRSVPAGRRSCHACGCHAEPDFRFCLYCGAALGPPA
ncbi:unnamed protein product [Prorocentrum cordatum]|uniref:Mei2-like C-terminal RNA recognition motif domain-containing protein n=1 Tax=Prorocentrum cordatum TaxID=2364126 RepID=A0ABN9QCK5_9DINO|nr:unnamed protein product [Polarella glacialis]